jgi:hypothetical protein
VSIGLEYPKTALFDAPHSRWLKKKAWQARAYAGPPLIGKLRHFRRLLIGGSFALAWRHAVATALGVGRSRANLLPRGGWDHR